MRQVIRAIYQLKRLYGVQVSFYRVTSSSTDRATGVITESSSRHVVNRAIVVTVADFLKFEYDLSYIAAAKNFVYGGELQIGDRVVIVDSKDANFEVHLKDYVVFESQRYNILRMERLEFGKGYILFVRQTQDQLPHQVVDRILKDSIILAETVVTS